MNIQNECKGQRQAERIHYNGMSFSSQLRRNSQSMIKFYESFQLLIIQTNQTANH